MIYLASRAVPGSIAVPGTFSTNCHIFRKIGTSPVPGTLYKFVQVLGLRVCKLFDSKEIMIVVGVLTNFECRAREARKYKFYYCVFFYLLYNV